MCKQHAVNASAPSRMMKLQRSNFVWFSSDSSGKFLSTIVITPLQLPSIFFKIYHSPFLLCLVLHPPLFYAILL